MSSRKARFSETEIAAYYDVRVPDLNRNGPGEWRGPCPIHGGEKPSFAVKPETGHWFCHSECGCGGGIIALEEKLSGADYKTTRETVYKIVGRKPKRDHAAQSNGLTGDSNSWQTVAAYVYTDETGGALFSAIRLERGEGAKREKKFSLQRYENGHRVKGLGEVRRVPYHLHEVVNATSVFIVEGEKNCETLAKWQLVASTSPLGAGKWSDDYAPYFKEKEVVVVPDNDLPGRQHALDIAGSLLPVAASVRVMELPGLSEKGDVSDWVEQGGTKEQFEKLAQTALLLDDVGVAKLKTEWKLTGRHTAPDWPFLIRDEGVFLLEKEAGGKTKQTRLAARLDVLAMTRDPANGNWGRLLRWQDSEGNVHQWAMPMEMLAAEGSAVRAQLLAGGLPFIANNSRLRERLTEFVQTAPALPRVRCVERTGWHGNTYVLPEEAIGPRGDEAVLYQSPYESVHRWKTKGTTGEWREHIGSKCCGNSRLIFAVSCAFAGPLLSIVGAESGGVHLHGLSSSGKTTVLLAGGSVCGGGPGGFLDSWRSTVNGLEVVAEAHNDATLFLDELSQVNPFDAGEAAYLLGNGQGKNRATRTIGVRRKPTWILLYVSSGELTLAEHAASVRKRTLGGAEVRLLNIEADAGKGLGVFEDIHGAATPDEFSRQLKDAVRSYFGTPFRAYLRFLSKNREPVRKCVKNLIKNFQKKYVPANASGEVSRAAVRFALIGAAGELATLRRLTGWQKSESMRVAARCFREWLSKRGTTGSSDMEAAVRQVRAFIEANGASRFEDPYSSNYSKQRPIQHRAGFVRPGRGNYGTEYLVLEEAFRNELCEGFSHQAVARELNRRGYLRREEPHLTLKVRLPGFDKSVRVFCILSSILSGGDDEQHQKTVGTTGADGDDQ